MSAPYVRNLSSRLPNRLWLCILIGLLLALQIFLRNKNLLNVNFDGWSYWEGASALSAGKGYVDLFGRPILAFPPLFSLYLSLFAREGQLTLGAIKSSFVVLAFLDGFVWAWLAFHVFAGARAVCRWLAISMPLLLFPVYFDMVLSEPLWLFLVGILLNILVLDSRSPLRFLLIGFFLSLCLLTRNVSVALLPALPVLVLPIHGRSDSLRVFFASFAGFIPWLAFRSASGSDHSHRFGFDLPDLGSDLLNSLIAMGRDFTFSRLLVGSLLFASLIILCLLFLSRSPALRLTVVGSQASGWIGFSIILFLSTVMVSHLTMVGAAQTRFYLIAFAAGFYGILLTASLLSPWSSQLAISLLVLLFVSSAVYRNGFFLATKLALPAADDRFFLSRPWLDQIHQHVQVSIQHGQSLEQALDPYPISVLRYKHWMGIPYPLQSH